MDAVAVSIASGISAPTLRLRDAFKAAAIFGAFQAVMPLAGYALGTQFAEFLAPFDHWIAFVLLAGLGAKLLHESRHAAEERIHSPFRTNKLLVLGFATSIDAFAVGITFSLLELGLAMTVATIGLVTFALCLPAVWFGARVGQQLGARFAQRAEIVGGLVLIGIGSNILYQHLSQGI